MEILNYDVAREFIKTGNRIEPKHHPLSWNIKDHTSHVLRISGYRFYCDYKGYMYHPDVLCPRTTVYVYDVPLEIAYLIYEKFILEKEHPIFKYDGDESFNPSVLNFLYNEIENVKTEITHVLLHYPNSSYFFSAEVENSVYLRSFMNAMYNGVDTAFNKITFIKNIQKVEKMRNYKIDYIRLCTMEQLEFALKLLNSEENEEAL